MIELIVFVISVALGALIVWWFFGSHETSKAVALQENGVQKVDIIVEGGYKPEVVQLKAGVPADVTFHRKTASGCFDEVLLPDFGQQAKLPVNQPYTFRLNPDEPGVFTYSCGMHMFFGKIEVVA